MGHADLFHTLAVLHDQRRIEVVCRRLDPACSEFGQHLCAALNVPLCDVYPLVRAMGCLALGLVGISQMVRSCAFSAPAQIIGTASTARAISLRRMNKPSVVA